MRVLLLLVFSLLPLTRAQNLEELEVGRLLLLSFEGTEAPLETLRAFEPAGFIFFPNNIASTAQVKAVTERLQNADTSPLLLGVDQEGGTVSSYRPSGATLFPGNMALGAAGDPVLARRVGRALGAELAYAGLNLNFAPVADVASRADNPIVGTRSFGSDPAAVSELARAFAAGLREAGVAAVAKHFPGHGATAQDSHDALPTVSHSREVLERLELPPFRSLITAGVPAIMSAHVVYSALDTDPATLSRQILTGLLRNELGFRGVVITDAMNMRAITDNYGPGEAAIRSVRAGADLLLLVASPEVQREVYVALQEAVASGRLSRARVREALARTEALAQRYRLRDVAQPDYGAHERLAQDVASQAATLLWNDGVLPLRASQNVLVVAPEPQGYGEAGHLGSFLKAARGNVRSVLISDEPTPSERDEAVRKAATADVVVLASSHGFGAFPAGLAGLEADLAALPTPLAVVTLGRPDDLRHFKARPDAYAAVYGYRDANLRAATALLLGTRSPTGRLPVRVDPYERGAGMKGYE